MFCFSFRGILRLPNQTKATAKSIYRSSDGLLIPQCVLGLLAYCSVKASLWKLSINAHVQSAYMLLIPQKAYVIFIRTTYICWSMTINATLEINQISFTSYYDTFECDEFRKSFAPRETSNTIQTCS